MRFKNLNLADSIVLQSCEHAHFPEACFSAALSNIYISCKRWVCSDRSMYHHHRPQCLGFVISVPIHWKLLGLMLRFGLSRLGTPVKEPNEETLKAFTVRTRSSCARVLTADFVRIRLRPHHTRPQAPRKRKWPRCFEWRRFYHATMTPPGCSGTSVTALPKSSVEFQEETKKNSVNFHFFATDLVCTAQRTLSSARCFLYKPPLPTIESWERRAPTVLR